MENESLKNIEQIEAYVEGRLDKDELQRFELSLKTDIELQEELELYKTLIDGIRSAKETDIRKKLNEIDKELDNTKDEIIPIRKIANPKIYWMVAASILLLCVTGALWFYDSNWSKTALIKKYTVEDPGLPVFMGINENHELDEAMNLYKTGKYQESFNTLEALSIKHSSNDTLMYYSGVLSLKLNKPREAIIYFQKVSILNESVFVLEAEYRLALALWQINEKEKAKAIFKTISNSKSHPYRNSSEEILKEM